MIPVLKIIWRSPVVEVVFILLLSLTVFTWFQGNHIIMTSAQVWPLNWSIYLEQTLSIWDDSIGTGAIASRQVAALPLAMVGAAAEARGVPAVLIQKIIFYVWFAGAGLSLWWLAFLFRFKRLSRLMSSLAYLTSPYALVSVWSQVDGLNMPIYLALPLGLAVFLNILLHHRGILAIITANLLLMLLLTPAAFLNPAFTIIFWVPLVLAASGYAIIYPRHRWYTIRTFALFTATWLLFNAFWFVPFVGAMPDEFVQASHQIMQAEDPSRILRSDIDTYHLNSVKAVDVLRQVGLWSIPAEHAGDPYYVWAGLAFSQLGLLLQFILPVMILLGLIYGRRRAVVVFLSILLLGSAFAILGPNPPGENLRLSINTAVPFLLRAFRAAYGKFGLLLALSSSLLISLGFAAVFEFNRGKMRWLSKVAVSTLVLIMFGIGGWPVWSGSVIQPGGLVLQPGRVKIPKFYEEMAAWLNTQQESFRLLPLPLSKTGSTIYRWDDSGYIGGDFIRSYSPHHPVLFAGTRNPLLLGLIQKIDEPKTASRLAIERILGLLNAHYILVHEDFHWAGNQNFMMFNDQTGVNQFLAEENFLQETVRWGDLVLFQPVTPSWLPKIYAAPAPTYTITSGANIADALALPNLSLPPAIYLHHSQQPDKNNQVLSIANSTVITLAVDDEALAQARRELSDAQSARSPFIKKRETAIELAQRAIILNDQTNVTIPVAGSYQIFLVNRWLTEQPAPMEISLLAENHPPFIINVESHPPDMSGDQYFVPLGEISLPAGNFELAIKVNEQNLSTVPPGIISLHRPATTRPANLPAINFEAIAPYRYQATIEEATEPFLLVFSETYHPRWQAIAHYQDGSSEIIPEEWHFPINGYANAWWIDDSAVVSVTLDYASQRFVQIGSIITLTSLIAAVVVAAAWYCFITSRRMLKWLVWRTSPSKSV